MISETKIEEIIEDHCYIGEGTILGVRDAAKNIKGYFDIAENTIAAQAERIEKLEAEKKDLLQVIHFDHRRKSRTHCVCFYCEEYRALLRKAPQP
jgi:hypothetical protein